MPKTPPRLRKARPATPVAAGPHTCRDCPECGTERCRTLQDLGMYCATLVAASEAARAGKRAARKDAVT